MLKIVFYLLALKAHHYVAGNFTKTPGSLSACVHENVTLHWEYENASSVEILVWHKNSNQIMIYQEGTANKSTDEMDVQHLNDGQIEIKSISLADKGNYSLRVVYDFASKLPTIINHATLAVLDPPSAPYFDSFLVGTNTTYVCKTDNAGTPAVAVKIKIGDAFPGADSAMVDYANTVECCVEGKAVTCMPNNRDATVFCNVVIKPTGPDDLRLLPPDTNYTHNIGDTLGPVACSANCTPNCTFTWTKNGTSVVNGTTLLHIITGKDDRGVYTCTATRGLITKDTRNITLNVRYGPGNIEMDPEKPLHAENENASFSIKCTSECYPPCTYTWNRKRDGKVLTETPVLSFSSLNRSDRGVYVCTVTNKEASIPNHQASRSITIAVRYGPDPVSFAPTGSPYIGNETMALKITCISSCYPGCSYTWKKGAAPYSDDASLNFNELHRTHAGTYTCTVKNNLTELSNSETGSVDVKVNYGPDSALLTPTTIEYIVNASTKLDDINCTSKCYPMCSHIWIKHGISPGVIAENGLLQLGNLTKEDAGDYVCTASNSKLSMSKNATVKMFIRYGPDKVRITPAGTTYSTEEGYTLPNFNCSSECYPGCTQTWNSETADVDVASGNVLSLGTANRTFTGNYKCTSTNNADEFRKTLVKSVFISVKYHPDVTVSQINGTSITEGSQNIMLTCSAIGDPTDYNFTEWIHYAPDGYTEIRKLKPSLSDHDNVYVNFPTTSYMDSGTYKCSVTNGIPNFTTKDMFAHANATQVVKGRPVIEEWKKDVVSETHDNTSLLVTYYSNDGSIPIVKWYRTENDTIQERNASEDKMFFEKFDENVTVEFYTANVVLPGYKTALFIQNVSQSDFGDYHVSVSNTVGTTVLTIHLNAQGAPDPPNMFSIVPDSITLSSVILTWICGFHGGADQTFYIQYNTSSSPWQTKAYVHGGLLENTRFNTTIDQLSAEKQYFFRIFAANEYGNSSFSRTILKATTDSAAENQAAPSNVGLIAGAAAGGVGLAAIFVVLVLLFRFLRERQDCLKSPSKRLLKDNERPTDTNGADDTPEINLNPMYESAGPLPSASNNSDVYSQVDKNKKKAKPVGDIYSQVYKPQKRQNSDGTGKKTNVCAQVQKQTSKEKDAGKSKPKKQKIDKKTRKGKQAEGDLYDNVDIINSTATKGDTVYENPSCSIEDEHLKKIRNQDGLLYADLDLPKETVGKDRKAVIHGLDEMTDYADIKYGAVGEQAPESDEESTKKE